MIFASSQSTSSSSEDFITTVKSSSMRCVRYPLMISVEMLCWNLYLVTHRPLSMALPVEVSYLHLPLLPLSGLIAIHLSLCVVNLPYLGYSLLLCYGGMLFVIVISFLVYFVMSTRACQSLLINENCVGGSLNKNEVIQVPPRYIDSKYWTSVHL